MIERKTIANGTTNKKPIQIEKIILKINKINKISQWKFVSTYAGCISVFLDDWREKWVSNENFDLLNTTWNTKMNFLKTFFVLMSQTKIHIDSHDFMTLIKILSYRISHFLNRITSRHQSIFTVWVINHVVFVKETNRYIKFQNDQENLFIIFF